MNKKCCIIFLLNILLLLMHAKAYAWPTSSQWIPIYKNSALLQDPSGDASGSRNVVSDLTHAAAYIYNDGTYVNFRLRLDVDPSGQGGQGALQAFGWGVELDTNQNAGNYEWLIMVDGISQTESISLWQNTIQGTLGDASDKPEVLIATVPLSGNYQVSMADSAINGTTDYFLDWRFPYATFKQTTGLNDTSPLRLFFGSSSSANNISSNGADMVGGSDLYSGLSDVITPVGTTPTTGTVRFVSDLLGNGDVTEISAGNTIFVSVVDQDRNFDNTLRQTVQVTLKATSGDSAVITLTETQVNSGVFTASIPTQSGVAVAGDGILQVTPGATVTVEYIDGIDALLNLGHMISDSLYVVSLKPSVSISKSVNMTTALPGQELIYSVRYWNQGRGGAKNLVILDTVPLNTNYVASSLRMGNAASTYATATIMTDNVGDDAAEISSGNIVFKISDVAPDDGVPNSGLDEGAVYFKVTVK